MDAGCPPSIWASASVKRLASESKRLWQNLHSLTACELLDRLRQVVCMWHRGAVDQHGNDRHVSLERCLDLDTDAIIGIVQTAAIVLVHADVVDVYEDALAPKPLDQTILDPSGEARRVVPPITNEDVA
jgi:hypothetical protein